MQGGGGRRQVSYLGEVEMLEGVLVVPAAFISFHNRLQALNEEAMTWNGQERDFHVQMPEICESLEVIV